MTGEKPGVLTIKVSCGEAFAFNAGSALKLAAGKADGGVRECLFRLAAAVRDAEWERVRS